MNTGSLSVNLTSGCIQDLPDEVFEVIASFLTCDELEACFNVNKSWRQIFNVNKIWRNTCFYSERFYKIHGKTQNEFSANKETNSRETLCQWRQYFDQQRTVYKNWAEGKYTAVKTSISSGDMNNCGLIVDSFGTLIMFDYKHSSSCITTWDITRVPEKLTSQINNVKLLQIWSVQDKIITAYLNYITVFEFNVPEYKLKIKYKFIFDMDSLLLLESSEPQYDFTNTPRYVTVDHLFIGYYEEVSDIKKVYFHIWNINIGLKMATQNAFQQSFVDFIQLSGGIKVCNKFSGKLLVFSGDSGRILVTLADEKNELWQISLFNLYQMKFVNVIAQIKSGSVWCFLKANTVIVYHVLMDGTSQVSVYNVRGEYLSELCYPAVYNPWSRDEFWFSGNRIILKVKDVIHVHTIVDAKKVHKFNFLVTGAKYILSYYEPRFLLLYEKLDKDCYIYKSPALSVSVWNVETGVKLWNIGNVISLRNYHSILRNIKYPRKLLVQFEADYVMSILNFYQNGD